MRKEVIKSKKLRYNFGFPFDMALKDLDEKLKEIYGFPLLNFAYVIADVLAEDTIFIKTIGGRSYKSMKSEIERLQHIKSDLIKNLERHFTKYLPSIYDQKFKNLNSKNKEAFFLVGFKLKPFFDTLNRFIRPLEKRMKVLENIPLSFFRLPDRTKTPTTFSYANQISFLWSLKISSLHKEEPIHQIKSRRDLFNVAFPEKLKIHWTKIIDLINWFNQKLKKATYKKKLYFHRKEDEITGHPKVLKNQFEAIRGQYITLILIESFYKYFPSTSNAFWLDETIDIYSSPKGKPIIAIKFYKNKIKTIFKDMDKLSVRETSFEKGKPISVFRDYVYEEEQPDRKNLLLEIS